MILAILSLGGLFQDHMVLQRGRANVIWGRDRPRQTVTLFVEGAVTLPALTAIADAAGRWEVACPPLPAGGPYEIRIWGSSEHVLKDVLVGDVWIAAGQSNMEFSVGSALNATAEIAAANFPAIRVAKVPRCAAATPALDVQVEWLPATPQNAASFTAVGYFFARDLHRSQDVPIGVIDATWGGTRVEAWASLESLRGVWPGIDDERARLAEIAPRVHELQAAYNAAMDQWGNTALPKDTENTGEPRGWAAGDFDDRSWDTIALPATVQSAGHAENGVFWFRRELVLPSVASDTELLLDLGAIDDHDRTYFNGELVGATGPETPSAHEAPRHYRVPARLVRVGRNVIAVRVFDRFGVGGFMGPADALVARCGNEAVPLAGPWRWAVERTLPRLPDAVFATQPPLPFELNFPNHGTALFNGMIAPLAPFGLRGFIWYQGESNVGQHLTYTERFTAMIRDWRGRFGQGQRPFYFVQLAGFEQNGLWPHLREAQTRALVEPQTGMAIALDVGDAKDIHPCNKQEVGRRLALLARAHVYAEPGVVARGPSLEQIEITGAAVRIHWRSATGLRTTDGSDALLGFSVAGADGQFHPAIARIEGETVLASSPNVPTPQQVRYAWADCPAANLVNGAGLPAEPFRTDAF